MATNTMRRQHWLTKNKLFTAIPHTLLRNWGRLDVPPGAQSVLLYLLSTTTAKKSTCWCQHSTIAAATNQHPKSVATFLKLLSDKGLLVYRPGAPGRSSEFDLAPLAGVLAKLDAEAANPAALVDDQGDAEEVETKTNPKPVDAPASGDALDALIPAESLPFVDAVIANGNEMTLTGLSMKTGRTMAEVEASLSKCRFLNRYECGSGVVVYSVTPLSRTRQVEYAMAVGA